jgi:small subunit ribosomal protein S4
MLNGKKATIPSQRLKIGDVITVREKSRKSVIFGDLKASGPVAPYMNVDEANLSARLEYLPPREEVPIICAEHLVVEFYSR